jgi:hypothetical protein
VSEANEKALIDKLMKEENKKEVIKISQKESSNIKEV